MLLSQQLIVLLLITLTHGDDCPIFFNPPKLVVEYGASASVNCSTSIIVDVIFWNISEGAVQVSEDLISWRVNESRNWELKQTCYISSNKTKCSQNLTVTLYKTPDSVSIKTVNYTGPMISGEQYKLQCDIQDVAPVKSLIVKWFKGENLVNFTTFSDTIKTPVNESATLLITANKVDDGVQYRCEAELELGPDGPQPPPRVTSESLNISISSQCLVQLNPPRVVMKYDSSVSVNCSTTVPHGEMGWEATEGSVPLTNDSLITWNIQHLRQWDIEPICYINYINGSQCESRLPVTIYKTPDSVSISTVDHTGPMIEDKQYKLQCDIQNVAPVNNLTVKWFKGETLVNFTTFNDKTKTPVSESATLLITANRTDDGVQYRCEAELELGPDGPHPPPRVTSEPLNITVHFKPQINVCNDWSPKIWSSLGSYPLNSSSVVGNPRPNISWRHRSSSVNVSKLLDKYDSGQYIITASNKHGNSSCIINITLEYPPELNCSENYQIKEKTLFKLPCLVDGSPTPDVFLYKDDKAIQLPYYPTCNDSGWHNLIASNKHGTAHHNFIIDILYAPMFDTKPATFTVVEDSNITLECSSTGNPEPEMWWSFNNKNISTERRHRHITLNIQKATFTSAGVYKCSATNEFGRQEKNFIVEIKGNFHINIAIVVAFIVGLLLFLIILLFLCEWRRRKSSGHYQIQSEKQYEMSLLSNGGAK